MCTRWILVAKLQMLTLANCYRKGDGRAHRVNGKGREPLWENEQAREGKQQGQNDLRAASGIATTDVPSPRTPSQCYFKMGLSFPQESASLPQYSRSRWEGGTIQPAVWTSGCRVGLLVLPFAVHRHQDLEMLPRKKARTDGAGQVKDGGGSLHLYGGCLCPVWYLVTKSGKQNLLRISGPKGFVLCTPNYPSLKNRHNSSLRKWLWKKMLLY
jgi:hypothetical protein